MTQADLLLEKHPFLRTPVDCRACRHSVGTRCQRNLVYGPEVYCVGWASRQTGPQKVRCADCSNVHYHPGPAESLSCDHHLVVTVQSLTKATRCCALFRTRHKEVNG